jgi:Phosphatidylglycerol lysyltransferase, C-terminal
MFQVSGSARRCRNDEELAKEALSAFPMTILSGFPKSLTLAQEIINYEQHLNESKFFRQITRENFASFSAQLAIKNDPDSYLTSPTYYAFTGRNGLWLYHKHEAFIPVCWHPNVPGQLLVFLLDIDLRQEILSEFLNDLTSPPKGTKLARIKSHRTEMLEQINTCSLSRSYICVPVTENVLDWKYPVRILSAEKVAAMQGADFRKIRNHVKKTRSRNVRVEPFSFNHYDGLRRFVVAWAQHMTVQEDKIASYQGPYEKMLHLLEAGILKADGFIVLINDEIQSFTLWDISNTGANQTANQFVNITNVKYRGLAEFNTVHMAEMLFDKGIQYLNIGGAESVGLDSFKKKFMPVESIELRSIVVAENNDGL